jgi:hypothetical protein
LGVLWIIIQDVLWVSGSIILLIWNPFELSPSGNIIIAAIALIVLIMGVMQYIALPQTDNISKKALK